MNRNYRVVFNQSTGTYVAVAENTTARKKSKTTVKTIVTALGVSAVMMGVSGEAQANYMSGGGSVGSNVTNAIVIGNGAQINQSPDRTKNNQSIAIGAEALVTGDQSTALGNNVYVSGHSSIGIGGDDLDNVIKETTKNNTNEYKDLTGIELKSGKYPKTHAAGHGSIAIGVQSQALGNFSTALGLTAKTEGTGAVAFGANAQGLDKGATSIGTASTASGKQATAIGMNSTATGKNSTAIGSGGNTPATATQATKDGAIAIGGNSVKGSQATGKNAIAIGGESIASEDNAVAIGVGAKSTHGNSVALGTGSVATGTSIGNAAWQPKDAAGNPIAVAGTATGEVSIGKAGSERRITNMAAGSADTDGVNVSQLKALDYAVTDKLGELNNNITAVGGKVSNLQTSVNTLEQGWKLQSDGDAVTAVKAGQTVAINSGTNIDVERKNNTITVNTTKDMTLNSVSLSDTAGNKSVLTSSGLNVSNSNTGNSVQYGSDALTFSKNGNTANAVSVGVEGINAGNQTITNVAAGALNATSKDAVNGSQLFQTNQNLNQVSNQVNQNTGDIANLSQGWKLQSDNDTASAVKAGDTVQINSGKNIDVSRDGNTLTIATADDLNLNSVNLQDASGNNSVLNASGLNVSNATGSSAHYGVDQLVFNQGTANAVSIGNAGINAGNQTITNVADGAINSASKDAINGSQLYDIQQEMQEHIKKAEDEAGLLGSTAVHYDSDSKTHITLGGKGTTAGTVGISNLADGKVETGSTDAVNGGQLYQTNQNITNLDNQVANLSQGWNLQSDGDTASAVKAGDTVQFNSGKNIDVSRDGNTLTIATADDLVLNSVNLQDASGNTLTTLDASGLNVTNTAGSAAHYGADQLVFNQGTANAVSIGNTGVNAGNQTITNVADGAINSASKDAINGSQLYDIQQEMQEHIKKAEDDAGILNSLAVQYDNSSKNHITLGGVNATSTVGISNLTDGKVESGSKDAVNGGQLYAVDQKVDQNTADITHLSQGWKIQSDGDTASSVVAGDTVQFNSGKNIEVSRDGNTLTIATADDLILNSVNLQDASGNTLTTLDASGLNVSSADGSSNAHYGVDQLVFNQGTANAVSVGETGISAGNQIISNVAAGDISSATSTDAVNGGQLYQTNQNVAQNKDAIDHLSQGWKIQSDGDTASSVVAGDTVQINSGKNIEVSRDGNTLTIATANDLELSSVKTVDGSGKSSVLDATGLQVDAGNGTWSSYGAGGSIVADDQGNQTSSTPTGTTVKDSQGNSTQVNSKGVLLLSPAGTELASLNQQQLSFSNGKPGENVTIGMNGISAGNQKITNVADGTLGIGSKDAVNGGQLFQTNKNVTDLDNQVTHLSQGWNLQTDGDSSSAIRAGDTVAINSGKNIEVVRVGKDITINTSDDLVVNSLVADDGNGNTMSLTATELYFQGANGQHTVIDATAGLTVVDINNPSNFSEYTLDGVRISNGGSTITIANDNVSFGGNTLSNVAAGVNAGDAVNKGQLDSVGNSTASALGGSSSYDAATGTVNAGLAVGGNTFTSVQDALNAVNQQANAGWKVSTEKGTTYSVAPNETVDFSNTDDNVVIKNTNGDITVDLAKDIKVNSVTAGDTLGNVSVMGSNGTTVTDALGNNANYGANGISINSAAGNNITIADNKVNFGGNTLSGIGAGVNPGDAVNKGQLDGLGDNLADNIFGGNATYDGNTITWSNIGGTGANTVDSAISSVNDKVNLGWNAADTAGNTFNVAAGQTVGFVNTDGNIDIAAAGSSLTFALGKDIKVNSVTAGDTLGNVSVMGSNGTTVIDALGNNAFYGAIGSQFTDKAGNSFNNSATGSIVTNAAGDSTNMSAGNISVSTGNGGTVSIGGNGIDAGGNNITNVADGKAPGDAVNKGQLDTAVDNINNSIGAAINGGVQYDKNADGTVNKGSITLEGGANGTTITNVANGKVEAGSKDAVNGGQLHDALQQINNNQSTINNDILGVTVGPDGKPKLDLDIYDVANQTKTGNLTLVDAINTVNQEGTKYAHTNAADESEEPGLINPDNNAASAGGKNSSAFGVNSIVDKTATNGLAMGYQSKVGEGATNSVSIGSQTQANGESSLALGHGSQANGKQSISIGTGNIVNGNHSGAIGDPTHINGDNSYSMGNNNAVDTDDSFILGNNVTKTAENSVNLGSGSVATTEASKHTAGTSEYGAAVIGGTEYAFAGGTPVGVVTVGAEGEERRVQNVAAGLISKDSTDAINGSQLHATNQAVGDLYQMNNKLNNRIDGLEDESRAGVATALAVANLPQVYIPGKSGLAIATGVHKGEVGYALGYSSISEGGNWVFKASATANRMGDVGGGAGLLYMFD